MTGSSRRALGSVELQPLPQSHPDVLTLAAWRNGRRVTSPTRGRLLEVGCGAGVNLLPMAAFMPKATFVGVGFDAEALGRARTAAARFSLDNLRFVDWSDLDQELGQEPFDFILLGQPFSFLSEATRGAMWRLCRQRLSPRGVVFLRFASKAGWVVRERIAALLRRFREAGAIGADTASARQLLELLDRDALQGQSLIGRLTHNEILLSRSLSDQEIERLYLVEGYRSWEFEDLCREAASQRLEVFEEATVPTSAQQGLRTLRSSLFQKVGRWELVEEAVDLVVAAPFRDVLLRPAGEPLDPPVAIQEQLSLGEIAAELESRTREVLLTEGREVLFKTPTGAVIRVSSAQTKAALAELAAAWPAGVRWPSLLETITTKLNENEGTQETTLDGDVLGRDLLDLQANGVLSLRSIKAWTPSAREPEPTLDLFLRWQTEQEGVMVTAHHNVIVMDPFSRALVSLLDGSRGREELLGEMRAHVEEPPGDDEEGPTVESMVDQTLAGLERAGVFGRRSAE